MKYAIDAIGQLLQKVPPTLRGWLYLGLVIVCFLYIGVTAWRSGFTPEQIIALLLSVVGGLAKSNTPNPRRAQRRLDRDNLED